MFALATQLTIEQAHTENCKHAIYKGRKGIYMAQSSDTLTKLSDQLSVSIDDSQSFISVSNGRVNNLSQICSYLNQILYAVSESDFVEDDISTLRKMQTSVRKVRDKLKSEYKNECKNLVQDLTTDVDTIDELLESILTTIQTDFTNLETEYREKKRQALLSIFNSEPHSVQYVEIENSSWYNHTFNNEKAIEQLRFRIELCDKYLNSCDESLRHDILGILRRHRYDALKVFDIQNDIDELYKEHLCVEEDESESEIVSQQTKVENTSVNTSIPNVVYATLEVDELYINEVLRFLKQNSISYHLV